jgi:hypothetical protein
MSVGQFGYRCDSRELVALGYSWVALVQCHAYMLLSIGAILYN